MSCKCEPDEKHYPEYPEKSTIYFIPCKFCGSHVYIRRRGDYLKVRNVVVLPEGVPLKLKFDPAETDLAKYKIHRDGINLNRPPLKTEESMEILYEMLADDDIDIDQFNKYSVLLNSKKYEHYSPASSTGY